MRSSRIRHRMPLALGLTLLLAGCSTTVAGSAAPEVRPQEPVDHGGLQRFYDQTVEWGECAPYVTGSEDRDLYENVPGLECADLELPLDYADPEGPTVVMAVLRSAATGSDRIGSLLFNPGGPGASGMSMVATFAAYGIGSDLHARFDFVGFDTRGTGSSRPVVQCSTDQEKDAERALNLSTATPEGIAEAERLQRDKAQRCAERTGAAEGIDGAAFLATVGSVDVVKDMDVLRAALRDDKLNYVGYSYGTLLGTLYAEAFPRNVRAMILDGAVDNSQTREESLIGQAEGFQQSFEEFAAACASSPTCVLGNDPSRATSLFQELTRPLMTDPAPVDDGRVLSYNDALTGTIQAMYSQMYWTELENALLDLAGGDGTALMALADSYEGRDADGHYSSLMDAFTAIHCVDDARLTDPEEARRLSEKYAAAAPFTDNGEPPSPVLDVCAYWPAPVSLEQHAPEVSPDLPELVVVSTTGDPATPYQAGVDLAEDLGASLITVEGTQHTAFLGLGNQCLDGIGSRYLIDLVNPSPNVVC